MPQQKSDLISILLGADNSRHRLQTDMQRVYQQEYKNTFYRYAANKARNEAMEVIRKEQEPGMMKRGIIRTTQNPPHFNPNAVQDMHARRMAVRQKIGVAEAIPRAPVVRSKGQLT